MRPRIVEAPLPFLPKKCVVSGRADGEIVDFGVDMTTPLPEPHLYMKRGLLEKAAELACGMASAAKVEEMQGERDDLIRRVAELEGDLRVSGLEYDAELRATAYHAASAAVSAILSDHPDIDFSKEQIAEAVDGIFEPNEEEANARV